MNAQEQAVLDSLRPELRSKVLQVLQHCNAPGKQEPGVVLHAFEGHRDPARQLKLYREGKSKLKFGQHNYKPSRACDLVFKVNGEWSWDTKLNYWAVGYWAEEVGLRWGGRFGEDESDLHPGRKAHEGMQMGWDPYHTELK